MNCTVRFVIFTLAFLCEIAFAKQIDEEVDFKDEDAKLSLTKYFSKRSFESVIEVDNVYDDEHQSVPSHEKAYFDSGPELSDNDVVELDAAEDFNRDEVLSIFSVFKESHSSGF